MTFKLATRIRRNALAATAYTATFAAVLSLALASCGVENDPESTALIDAPDVAALTATPNDTVQYSERSTGKIWSVTTSGIKSAMPIGTVELTPGVGRMLGLAHDETGRTFASWIGPESTLLVGQVAPGATRVIWKATNVDVASTSGALAFTPTNRLAVAMQDTVGKVVTLNPDMNEGQLANEISKGWSAPSALAYDQGKSLWVFDRSANGDARIARAGADGPIGTEARLPKAGAITGFTVYGEQEMAACTSDSHVLVRLLLNEAKAIPGRTLANDCTRGVAQLSDGRLAYATNSEIRISAI